MRPSRLAPLVLLLCAAAAPAQQGSAPLLTRPAEAPYPAAARTAHVQGTAIVRFTVEPTGATSGVQTVSGPPALTHPLEGMIRGWHFVTPLPKGAETRFEAIYRYALIEPGETPDTKPADPRPADTPDVPGQDDMTYLPGEHATVSGFVRSENNRQEIDVTPADPHPPQASAPIQ